jgi:hypothetical protein
MEIRSHNITGDRHLLCGIRRNHRNRCKMDTPRTDSRPTPPAQIHDRQLSWLGTDTPIKNGGAKLVETRGGLDIALCDIVCYWLMAGRWFSPSTPVSSTNKTGRHAITEICLKVALNTINLPPAQMGWTFMWHLAMSNPIKITSHTCSPILTCGVGDLKKSHNESHMKNL